MHNPRNGLSICVYVLLIAGNKISGQEYVQKNQYIWSYLTRDPNVSDYKLFKNMAQFN
jgi:hypothetical protein